MHVPEVGYENLEYELEYFGPIYHIFYKIIFIGFVVICSFKKIKQNSV